MLYLAFAVIAVTNCSILSHGSRSFTCCSVPFRPGLSPVPAIPRRATTNRLAVDSRNQALRLSDDGSPSLSRRDRRRHGPLRAWNRCAASLFFLSAELFDLVARLHQVKAGDVLFAAGD